jgi:hypothetical protein
MVKRHDVLKMPVEHVQVGFSLAIESKDGLPPRAFQVDGIQVVHKRAAGEKPRVRLSSEALHENGARWDLEYPFGTEVTRVVRTYDDGT